MTQQPTHSPLGASSAERWMNCPGSVSLLKQLSLGESDEPDYRSLGTAAHELAATCLRSGEDTWEYIGTSINKHLVDKEMADAVQVYLNAVRVEIVAEGSQSYIEYGISHPAHRNFYGTLDCGVISGDTAIISDYKHGEGIAVRVQDNPQLKYYAFGFIKDFPQVKRIILRIIQPRISYASAVQEWTTTREELETWANNTLLPAMQLAELDGGDLQAGDWCRFCPAKLICPLMTQLFGAAMTANPQKVVALSNESLGRSYGYIQAVKMYIKVLEEEIYNRLNRGQAVAGCKLVPKKANRVFKPEAYDLALEKFGEEAFSKPELKTPAEIDKLGATGKSFTREFAFTPQTGLTVAAEDDARVGIKMQTSAQTFGKAVEALNG